MDIEALAQQAGMRTELQAGAASCVWTDGVAGVSAEQLDEFARLVAEAGSARRTVETDFMDGLEPPGCPTPGACSCKCDNRMVKSYVQVLEHRARLRQMLKDFMDHEQSRGHPLYADAIQVLRETYP